ncbi:Bkd operon transcriptional regulator [Citreicella sp. SE45]|uniref:Transcriptional regulator, AsnC family n=1 Tax=Salipiger thiooxidans TaxID=282683 RepID=A0A1G7HQ04_9RHOB|nr:Lrp/AsnC family transcriptional regulator [Salipiger thiooxidans]EEX15679.1 Bkd operon transcriptional regulator [Citreicella sp. SE45]SDF02542.1 transcriptional regulator, AsnC family [Salipiger thiooxidans]
MDRIDRKILDVLQSRGRIPVVELAEQVGLSATPCRKRIASMEESGLIARYGAEIDHERAGYPITAFVSIELERQEADSLELFERRVMDFEEVVQGFLMTGSQDFLLRVVVEDLHAFERFLQHRLTRIPGIRSVRSRFALRQFVGRNRLPSRD